FAFVQDQFSQLSPLASRQPKSARQQRVTLSILSKVDASDIEWPQDPPIQVLLRNQVPRLKLSSKHFAENLQLARTVNERLPARAGRWQPDNIPVSIANASPMQRKCGLDSSREVQEVPDTDIRFARIRVPLSYCVANRFVEIQNSILDRGRGGDTPEALGTAKDRGGPIHRIAVCIFLVGDSPVTYDQERVPVPRRCIFGSGLQRPKPQVVRGGFTKNTWHRHADQHGKKEVSHSKRHISIPSAQNCKLLLAIPPYP